MVPLQKHPCRNRQVTDSTITRTDILGQDEKQGMASSIPLGRMCTPRDVANAVAYLASDDADFITGVNLQVRCLISTILTWLTSLG